MRNSEMTIEVGIPNNKDIDATASNSTDNHAAVQNLPETGDYRSTIREIMDQEFKNIVIEEIRNAVQELTRTQRIVIGIVKEDFKKILSEVLEEKKQAIMGSLKKTDSP
jgi:hypothetical protein